MIQRNVSEWKEFLQVERYIVETEGRIAIHQSRVARMTAVGGDATDLQVVLQTLENNLSLLHQDRQRILAVHST